MSRSPLSAEVRTFLHDRFEALLEESDPVIDNAACGQTVHNLADILFDAEREFLREIYQQKLQERIAQMEGTAESQCCPKCKKNALRKHEPQRSNDHSRSCEDLPFRPAVSSLRSLFLSC